MYLKLPHLQIWIVLNNLNYSVFEDRADSNYGYRLKAGDILRFGRVRFIGKVLNPQSHFDFKVTYIFNTCFISKTNQ